MNSIIEAQITLKEETEKEMERCIKDPVYFFENYMLVGGKKRKLLGWEKKWLRDFKKQDTEAVDMNRKYPLTPDQCFIGATPAPAIKYYRDGKEIHI